MCVFREKCVCVWEWMNEWMSRCVCLERERNVCVDYSYIYIYIHSPARLRDVRVVFVFNASESDWTPTDSILLSVVCVENEWVNRCVCLEREVCVCVCIDYSYIYSLTCKIERCESCVCFQYFWNWLNSFWFYVIICCVCENEWMNEWVDVFREREKCVCVDYSYIYIFTHLQDWEMRELCLFSILLKLIELLLILCYYLLCVWEWMNEWMSRCV
jgi:hypothetical protein